MTTKALLFIPDISGFTEFVHHTAITHSKHIVAELFEILLNSNSINLELAEVEGDALFMFKVTDEPNINEIEEQVKQMYVAFHTHLKRYELERICHCGACSSAYNLTLKFVVHYGEIDFIEVKDIRKPYGSNVIQVHRLLKNNVPISEYALYTEQVKSSSENTIDTITESYDFGTISYSFISLTTLKSEIPKIDPIPDNVPKNKILTKLLTININVLDLYELISNFDYRLLWVKGVDALDYEKNKVNRAGVKHQCLFNNNNEVDQVTVKRDVEPNQMVYGEMTNDLPFTKRATIYYILEEIEKDKTKLNVEVFIDFKPFGFLMKPLLVKNLRKNLDENLKELTTLATSEFSLVNATNANENT